MAAALRRAWTEIVTAKNAVFDSHEQYGRRNIARACLLTYASVFFLFKFRGSRKQKKLEQQKAALKHDVVRDALARAGLQS